MRQKPHIILSFGLPDNEENKALIKGLRMLAAKDGWSLSQILREASLEYLKRHDPGNPQLALVHWTSSHPLPITIQEKNRKVNLDEMEREKREKEDTVWKRLNDMSTEDLERRYQKLQALSIPHPETMQIAIILKAREKK